MLKKEVIEKAKAFCEKHKVNTYPVKIIDLCSQYGFSVFKNDLKKETSGYIIAQDKPIDKIGLSKIIVVNAKDSMERQRFTVAHELAHFILHHNGKTLYAHRDDGQAGGIENEADEFAANVLMPENLVKEALSYLVDESNRFLPFFMKVDFIANQFAVSKAAAQVRLEQLGIR